MTNESSEVWNCAQWSNQELSQRLQALPCPATVELRIAEADFPPNGVAAGLNSEATIVVNGDAGHFFYLMGAQADLHVQGQVGDNCGHSMASGRVLVQGNAGHNVGAFATGGFLAVLGSAGNRCGMGLNGADVLVRSRAGDQAGFGMRAGGLVLGNGAGHDMGAGMTGGVLFVRGEIRSQSGCIRASRMQDAESMQLSLLLARAGIKVKRSEFKVFRARSSEP